MLQDQGPRYNIGFGIPQQRAEKGTGNSNAVEKALSGHPVMRFFAVSAATIGAMAVGGKIVREGGLKFALKAQEAAAGTGAFAEKAREGILAFRKIEDLLDSVQGVNREYVDPNDLTKLVKKDGLKLVRDRVDPIDSFNMRYDEELGSTWKVRDSLQRKLVAQARRLPYEAPGLFVAQKAVIDPITGANKDPKNQVNWSNPFDVIGDFSYQTMKNLFVNVLPFEAGGAALSTGYQRYAAQALTNPGNGQLGFVTTRAILNQLGVEFSTLTNKTIRLSHQSIGAFSHMIQDSSENSLTATQWVRQRSQAFANSPEYANAGYARRMFMQAKAIVQNRNGEIRQAVDALPSPFKGMGSGIIRAKDSFKETGDIYDEWQKIVSGRKSLASLKRDDPTKYNKVLNFMEKGGGTHLEQYANASYQLGRGDPIHPDGTVNLDWRNGTFFKNRSEYAYKQILAKELSDSHGLTVDEALKFVKTAHHISPVVGGRSPFPGGEALFERFKYVSNDFHANLASADKNAEWWDNFIKGAGAHGINFKNAGDRTSFDVFTQAVSRADSKFGGKIFQQELDKQIQAEWKVVHGQIIAPEATKALTAMKQPFELFSGARLPNSREFLVKRTAARLGISLSDSTGNPIHISRIENQLRGRGFNPNNLQKLRGFLVDQKEIAAPWSINGSNLFGFKPLNLHTAIQNNYFGAHEAGVRKELSYLVDQKTFSPTVGRGGNRSSLSANRWDLKINRTFVDSRGNVLDFGRIGRHLIAGLDKVESELQVPLIHLKPLQTLGWSSFKAMRNSPAVLMADGFSTQPIAMAAGKEFKNPDFYLYLKASTKSSKGKVVGVASTLGKNVIHQEYAGIYRPFTTNVQNMLGRYGNIILGEKDIPSSKTQKNPWKRLFDVSLDQENNLAFGHDSVAARWYRAYKRRPEAYKNPFIAAERFSDRAFNPLALTPDESEGFSNLITMLRGYGFSSRSLKNFAKMDDFKGHFTLKLNGIETNVLDVENNLLPKVIHQVLDQDKEKLRNIAGVDAKQVSRLQQNLRNLLSQGEKQSNYWDLTAPNSVKMTGISRRVDQLKSEFFDYMLVRNNAMSPATAGNAFDDTVQKLMTNLENLYTKGVISSTEKAEGRAAILSLHMDHARNSTYVSGSTLTEHNSATLQELLSRDSTRELLGEVGSGYSSHPQATKFIRRRVSRTFRQTPYERPFQNNPTGTQHVFMPTTGTVFARNPVKALAGVAGFTWRDPEAMSGGMMPMTHLVGRLNKYFENFGLGLDETMYRSPVDLYARGFVGKRVLPIYAAGATALAVDRTIGGFVNDKDQYGNRVYSPFFLGKAADVFAAGQIGLAGVIPGGQTAEQKKYELTQGEVPIRKGRFWILGNTPFRGGRIQYFRPSWYQRLKAGGTYTPEMKETPFEKLLYGYDFSPLRPLDPYRREREDYNTRPYPLSGDYFTGPWGPLTGFLNATVGRVMKPRRRMHGSEVQFALGQYQPVGESGAYYPTSPVPISGGGSGYGAAQQLSAINSGYMGSGQGTPSSSPFYGGMGYSQPRGQASAIVRSNASNISSQYSALAFSAPSKRGQMSPRVVSAGGPLDYGTTAMSARRLGYQSQELFGIYGFAAASLREGLGFGNKDIAPSKAVLEPASRGYSSNRSFWNLQLGGIGDLPLPIEGRFSNLEISEIIRRFVPKEPSGMNYINNIPNAMGKRYPWLPGVDYPLANIKSGDPYNAVPDAEIRLPGIGYARTHRMYPDATGQLGLVNVHDILGDVAPWSQEYKFVDTLIKRQNLNSPEQQQVNTTRAQVEAMRYKNEFTPYNYKYNTAEQMLKHPTGFALGRGWEWLTHRDTYLNTKLGAPRTAVEDWERNNVYGATFPSWENPISSFLAPSVYKATQRNPFAAAGAGASLGFLFGSSPESKAIGAVVGGLTTTAASLYGNVYEAITGQRFIPMDRKKQAAVEEYADIFEYIRSSRLSAAAARQGDVNTAKYFQQQANTTMYGMNFDTATPEKLAMAVPKRKREHFRAMLYAPEQEREQILSTAPRLERRLFEAAWGMPIEEKPDLRSYFEEHELPPPDSDIWLNGISQDTLKIKMGQSLGLDLAQMGYYPQQIQEANLLNPAYPDYTKPTNRNRFSIKAQLKRFLFDNGINGIVTASPSPFPGNRLQLNAGSY